MPIDHLFGVASSMAEKSLEFLSAAESAIADGRTEDALACLRAVAILCNTDLDRSLMEAKEELAGVAQGQITVHGFSGPGPLYFASAHDAVRHIWTVVYFLLDRPAILRSDLCEWLGVNTSALSAYLIRERARLLPPSPAPVPVEPHELLDPNEHTILLALRNSHPKRVFLADIAADTGISRKTCEKVANILIGRGLADRAKERSGTGITPKGLAVLAADESKPLTTPKVPSK